MNTYKAAAVVVLASVLFGVVAKCAVIFSALVHAAGVTQVLQ